MHPNAEEYDKQHGVCTRFLSKNNKPYPEGFVPEGRPCDWCGCPVEKGFIHESCQKLEMDLWLDILY